MHEPIDLLAELRWRGMLQLTSEGLEARLARGQIRGYVGFDPTGPSLHVGHLIQVILLTHLQRAGGQPMVVVGGGTGMVGDPSGRSAERNLLDEATLERNKAAFRAQLGRFLDFSPGPTGALMIDNREWLGRYGLLDFLREVGKHFRLGDMLAKESVQQRLAAGGLSFTEFAYMTLQATDFLVLHRDHGVDLQMGGADQWGNLTAGLELIRRVEGRPEEAEPSAFALCSPLLLTAGGQKMGKTERGALYLDPALSSPYEFYQYWVNQEDILVSQLLRWLTLKPREEIEALEAEQAAHPETRPAQRALARDLTARVHGEAEADLQRRVSEAAFGGDLPTDPAVLDVLFANMEHFEFDTPATVFDLALGSGAFGSRAELRRVAQQGGLTLDGARVSDVGAPVPAPIAGLYHVLRVGRRRIVVGRARQRPG